MIAHIRASDKKTQSLAEHCRNVSRLCKAYAEKFGVGQLAALIGLLHDIGKETSDFCAYLLDTLADANAVSPHNHAHTGAIFAYRRYFLPSEEGSCWRLTAQIVMLCVQGHHAGLADCWDCTGDSPLLRSLQANEARAHAAEASAWFVQNVASEAELDTLFDAACEEIAALFPDFSGDSTRQAVSAGLLCRLLLSVLVDADRWDAACFEYGENPFSEATPADWVSLLETFEHFRETNLNGTDGINRIRAEISDICDAKATAAPGIFTLTVPTGGGKTYASLRHALRHAQANGLRRIFYIIPYNTIFKFTCAICLRLFPVGVRSFHLA